MRTRALLLTTCFALACGASEGANPFASEGADSTGQGDGDGDGDGDSGDGDSGDGDGDGDSGDGDGDGDGEPLFDVAIGDGDGDGDEEGDPTCDVPVHEPCDGSNDPVKAMGLGCEGEWSVQASVSGPQPTTYGVRSSFGPTAAFDATEGEQYAVLGTGYVADLDLVDGPNDCNDATQPSYQNGQGLPAPMVPLDAGGTTCDLDPSLVGQGDCSNTMQAQYEQGVAPYDYSELRFSTTVPDDVSSFSFDFAFLSYEYPVFYGKQFNDMFVAWLESENWTGNVSFDGAGNPISLNASFLDYRDAEQGTPNDPDCAGGCVAEELHDTCMQGHAGTKWLTSSAEVTPGEDIMMVFGIFDLSDPNLDSYVFLDNFEWGCGEGPPETLPEG